MGGGKRGEELEARRQQRDGGRGGGGEGREKVDTNKDPKTFNNIITEGKT